MERIPYIDHGTNGHNAASQGHETWGGFFKLHSNQELQRDTKPSENLW